MISWAQVSTPAGKPFLEEEALARPQGTICPLSPSTPALASWPWSRLSPRVGLLQPSCFLPGGRLPTTWSPPRQPRQSCFHSAARGWPAAALTWTHVSQNLSQVGSVLAGHLSSCLPAAGAPWTWGAPSRAATDTPEEEGAPSTVRPWEMAPDAPLLPTMSLCITAKVPQGGRGCGSCRQAWLRCTFKQSH